MRGIILPLMIMNLTIREAKWIIPTICSKRDIVIDTQVYIITRAEALSPDASPLLDTGFEVLPKTLILCAEYYTYFFSGTNHCFMNRAGGRPQGEDLIREFAEMIKSMR